MSTRDEKACLKIRLTKEEKAKLEHGAALCGLTKANTSGRFVWASGPGPSSRPSFGNCWTPYMKSTTNWKG